ncbi:MAG: RNA-guided pseudouridylation complex pseudouridine synthase subunit Cbf5, partial [Nanoarchaeota archaeon]|nr:RNA-guided pseudouridylation complex pseudouridine synthase subunit Cbf5 [Nanoarchaeota archaeon]
MGLPFESIKREVNILREEETDKSFGRFPSERSLGEKVDVGFVLVDKPAGMRSRTVSTITKNILSPLGVTKAGYSGTLDPGVTGLLPITFNRANKAISMLLLGGKEYVALMHLHKDIDEKTLLLTMNKFKGKIVQLPPVRSNVKRVNRERTVYYLDVLEIKGRDVLFRAGVESGTYIRKLIH